jgi:hypothetical protein
VAARLDSSEQFQRMQAIVEVDRSKKQAKILYVQDLSHLRLKAW